MSPELLQAVKERVAIGHTWEQIYVELKQAGYDDVTISAVYREATNPQTQASVGTIPSGDVQAGVSGDAVQNQAATQSTGMYSSLAKQKLPGFGDMLKDSVSFAWQRKDLLGVLILPYIILGIAGIVFFISFSFALVGATFLLFVVATFVSSGVVLHGVAWSGERRVPLGESLNWLGKNIWGYVWVGLLTMLVILGGFLLIYIPGIIAMISTFFAVMVFAKEGARGMAALRRSRGLAEGYKWEIFGNLLLLFIVLGVASLLFGVVLSTVLNTYSTVNNSYGLSIASFIHVAANYLIGAVFQLVMLRFMLLIYNRLVLIKSSIPPKPDTTVWQYRVLAGLGVAFFVFYFVVVAFLISSFSALFYSDLTREPGTETDMRRDLINTENQNSNEFREADASEVSEAKDRATELREQSNIGATAEGAFIMPVDDIFSIEGKGVVLSGRILQGSVAVGDTVEMVVAMGALEANVVGIEVFNRETDKAGKGENVGIVLSGITNSQAKEARAIATIGVLDKSDAFEVELQPTKGSSGGNLEMRSDLMLATALAGELISVEVVNMEGGLALLTGRSDTYSFSTAASLMVYKGMEVVICAGDCIEGDGEPLAEGRVSVVK